MTTAAGSSGQSRNVRPRVDRLVDGPDWPTGYTLLSWLGACPDERLDDVLRPGRAMTDAPKDAGTNPELWGADRIRSAGHVGAASGWRYYSVAARHDAAGELAALTQLGAEP